MDILQQLTSLLSTSGSFNQISRNANTSPEKAQQLATIAIPILLEALNRNTATLQGVRSLSYALDDHQHFDLNNLSEFFRTSTQKTVLASFDTSFRIKTPVYKKIWQNNPG